MYAIFAKHFGSNAEHASEVCRVGNQEKANEIARSLAKEKVLVSVNPYDFDSKKKFCGRYSFVEVREVMKT